MNFTVNWSGQEKEFEDKRRAIMFMDSLDVGSDLWTEHGWLLCSREKLEDGTFTVDDYKEDPQTFSPGPDVLVLGPNMIRIDIGMEEGRERCLPMFTKMTPGPARR